MQKISDKNNGIPLDKNKKCVLKKARTTKSAHTRKIAEFTPSLRLQPNDTLFLILRFDSFYRLQIT